MERKKENKTLNDQFLLQRSYPAEPDQTPLVGRCACLSLGILDLLAVFCVFGIVIESRWMVLELRLNQRAHRSGTVENLLDLFKGTPGRLRVPAIYQRVRTSMEELLTQTKYWQCTYRVWRRKRSSTSMRYIL